MKSKLLSTLAIAAMLSHACPCIASANANTTNELASVANPSEAGANTNAFPKQILRTGINLSSSSVSANSVQLAGNIHLTPVLERIQSLRQKIDSLAPSPERSEARLDMLESKEQAMQIIARTNFEIDFVMAEMKAEQNVYNEILSTFASDRDKTLAKVNAVSFISNGALWAVCEGLAIPTHTKGVYAVSSGITGILAGIIPSFASLYTLKAVNGKKKTSEVEPNMLAKLFNYPTSPEIEYPSSVWLYLNEVPPGSSSGKTRKDQMVDRWISDANIPNFTNRDSKAQLGVITASVAQKKGLSIATLNTRLVMIEQLSAEVMKMKRMLLELSMVVQGEKQLVATELRPVPTSKNIDTPRSIASKRIYFQPDAAANLTAQTLESLGVP
ncbi:MAG: hypothetical protein JST89_14840 [Cyanobacteria bacterium SZAS-4]|nr:hypothetical protein [Cyanobacteria bacterium SZAS-4]